MAVHIGKAMTPDEIVTNISARSRELIRAAGEEKFTRDQVLALMDAAGMQGFTLGSNMAMSMVQGALAVQLARYTKSDAGKGK